MSIQHFLFWLPMTGIAIANGTLRQYILTKYFDELRAHQLSTLILITFCSVYVGLIYPFLSIQKGGQAILIGLVWVGLTVLFECTLGRLANRSWKSLLRDYDITKGRIWLIFLFCLFLLPYVFYVLKK